MDSISGTLVDNNMCFTLVDRLHQIMHNDRQCISDGERLDTACTSQQDDGSYNYNEYLSSAEQCCSSEEPGESATASSSSDT